MNKKNFTFNRHDLLYLKKDFSPCASEESERIHEWISHGYPVIVRRPGVCKNGNGVHCGISLPPAAGKKRIAFTVPTDAIEEKMGLPFLSTVKLETVSDFIKLCDKNGFAPKVFGSLAWEHITGMEYFTESSDIDILFNVSSNTELYRLQEMLSSVPEELIKLFDIEIVLWNGDAFSWREFLNSSRKIMVKNINDVFTINKSILHENGLNLAENIGYEACSALYEELETYPKPGLVSYFDRGSHKDMDSELFRKSISSLKEYFIKIAEAGMGASGMTSLRQLGICAEEKMFAVTDGVNTHRGAIFTLGLLAAAAGYKLKTGSSETLGGIVKNLWSDEIMDPAAIDNGSHGYKAMRIYGLGGAREEAASGFSSIYGSGLTVFKNALTKYDRNTARLCAFFAMLEEARDSTLLYRGGLDGLEFARKSAESINKNYEPATIEWQNAVLKMHHDFIIRNLSAGGVADLLSAVIFIERMEELCRG